jgi:peptidoglycan/LPS O-acetylase OafA/YrhL
MVAPPRAVLDQRQNMGCADCAVRKMGMKYIQTTRQKGMSAAPIPEAPIRPKPSESKYRPEIDGLRAFAVVAVIINHFNKDLLPSGYLGVDIFFVISGYVITSSLAGRESKNFLDFLTGFYERRLKRLVPALVVFVLLTSVLICLFNPEPSGVLGIGWNSLFGVSNISLYRSSTDYFAQSTALNPFTHTWSLGVEEQFYLLFPFLIWFSGFGRQTVKGARNLFLWVGALTIASLIGFIYLYQVNQPAAYFLMPPRFWEMAAGCLVFIGFQKRARIEQALEQVPPLLVVAAMVGVLFLPVSAAVPSTISIVVLSAILIACLKQHTAAYKLFTREKVVFVGLISYSLYLWHWTVLSISRWTIGIHWWSVPLQVALMVLMAIASYKWIETPIRTSSLFRERFKTIASGIGVLFGVSCILFAYSRTENTILYLMSRTRCSPFQSNTCQPPDFPHLAVTPFFTDTRIQRKSCFQYHGPLTDRIAKLCTVPPAGVGRSTIFIAGSSYAHHLTPAFQEFREKNGVGISMLVHSGCDLDPLLREETPRNTCRQSNKTRWAYILKNISPGDLLFTGVTGYRVDHDAVLEIARLASKSKFNVVYFTPIPTWKRLPDDVQDLCATHSTSNWLQPELNSICKRTSHISRSAYLKEAGKSIDFLVSVERSNSFFHVYPIHDILCGKYTCESHYRKIRLYRDNDGHISLPAAKGVLGRNLRTFLESKRLLRS